MCRAAWGGVQKSNNLPPSSQDVRRAEEAVAQTLDPEQLRRLAHSLARAAALHALGARLQQLIDQATQLLQAGPPHGRWAGLGVKCFLSACARQPQPARLLAPSCAAVCGFAHGCGSQDPEEVCKERGGVCAFVSGVPFFI